jgi:hypothetical protein
MALISTICINRAIHAMIAVGRMAFQPILAGINLPTHGEPAPVRLMSGRIKRGLFSAVQNDSGLLKYSVPRRSHSAPANSAISIRGITRRGMPDVGMALACSVKGPVLPGAPVVLMARADRTANGGSGEVGIEVGIIAPCPESLLSARGSDVPGVEFSEKRIKGVQRSFTSTADFGRFFMFHHVSGYRHGLSA